MTFGHLTCGRFYTHAMFTLKQVCEEIHALTQRGNDGLQPSIGKTECIECGCQVDGETAIGGANLGEVIKFKCLGLAISSHKDLLPQFLRLPCRAHTNSAWREAAVARPTNAYPSQRENLWERCSASSPLQIGMLGCKRVP